MNRSSRKVARASGCLSEPDDRSLIDSIEFAEVQTMLEAADARPRDEPLRFPRRGTFRRGPRYCWLRCVGGLAKLISCRCRKPRDWENPKILSRNTLRSHSFLKEAGGRPLLDDSGRILPEAPDSRCRLDLSGPDWKFKYFNGNSPQDVKEEAFTGLEIEDSSWSTTPVPSNWQTQGVETPVYTNMAFPWTSVPILKPSFNRNPFGVYRRHFELPADFLLQNRQVRIVLHGVSAACYVWLDGQLLGYHQDSGQPAEFDVTTIVALAPTAEHVLAVQVMKYSDGLYIEDQDTWWLNGIYRDVTLYSVPATNVIQDYRLYTKVAAPYDESADAEVHFEVAVSCNSPCFVRCVVWDGDRLLAEKQETRSVQAEKELATIFGSTATVFLLNLLVPRPAKWSPDNPKLYTARIELHCEEGLVQTELWNFGIRDLRISEEGVLRLNGKELKVHGVNRVEMSGTNAKAVTDEETLNDLLIMKRHNFNAVRTSHCPNKLSFYHFCDQLGLLVIDEANSECHGFAMLAAMSYLQCQPGWQDAYLKRVTAMFGRDKNFTSIVGWSLGNESGMGPAWQSCADWLRLCDHTRFVQFESGCAHGDATLIMGDGRHPATDIICPMYTDPEQCISIAKTDKRPLIMCEYSHAMGNSNGGLHLFYKVFDDKQYPTVQGGFIWDFVDQGLKIPRAPNPAGPHDYWLDGNYGYGGDFGPDSGADDKWFVCNGLNNTDRRPKPAMEECKYLMQPIKMSASMSDTVIAVLLEDVEGRPLDNLVLKWQLTGERRNVFSQGSVPLNEQTSQTSVSLNATSNEGGLWLKLRAELASDRKFAPVGHAVATQTVLLRAPAPAVSSREPVQCAGSRAPFSKTSQSREAAAAPATVEQNGDVAIVKGTNYTAVVRAGVLTDFKDSAASPLLSAAHGMLIDHAFWRAGTDNDRGGADVFFPFLKSVLPRSMISKSLEWANAGLESVVSKVTKFSWSESVLTVQSQHGPQGKSYFFSSTVTMNFTMGSVSFDIQVSPNTSCCCNPVSRLTSLARVGMRFVLPSQYSLVSWLGCGSHESYPDRKASAFWDVHQKSVEGLHFPYMVPGECGGIADVHWVALQAADGRGLLLEYSSDDAPAPQEVVTSGKPGARPAGMIGAQVSASRWTPAMAHAAMHDHELVPTGQKAEDQPIVLHVDTAHAGIGGTGGATEAVWRFYKQYLIDPKTPEWNYRLVLTPLAPGEFSLANPTL